MPTAAPVGGWDPFLLNRVTSDDARSVDLQHRYLPNAASLGKRETLRQKRAPFHVSVRRQVWIEKQGRCQFVSPVTQVKCGSTAFLDIDHILPVSQGGTNDASNLTLACSLHNRRRPFWRPEDQPLYAAMLTATRSDHCTPSEP